MSSITSIKNAITEIKKITDQPHYKKLNVELNYLFQSIAIIVEEYKDLLRHTRLYISTILYVVNELYKLSGDESAFKTKIDSLSNNKTFEYNIKPANGSIQKKTVNYSYFDTFSFDVILTILNAVKNKQSINNSQFYLPSSPSDRNEIADKITVNLNTIIQERVNIGRYLESIKTNASKLKVTPTQSTTPTSVANSSGKVVDDYIKEFPDQYYIFDGVNDKLDINGNKLINSEALKQNATNIPFLTKQIQINEEHINLVNQYQADILNSNKGFTQKDISETLESLKKGIKILTALLNIAKGATQDSKPTPPVSPTVKTSPTPTTTPTKPDEKKPEVPLTSEQWGIKFTAGKSFYMDLLPARQSTIPVQGGRDVPNAMPGLNYKLVTQVGKQPIPGFSPVYQNLGVKGMQVTIVGAFTGADGDNTRGTDTPIPKDPKDKTPTWINPKGSPSTSDNPGRGGKLPELSAYNSYTEFVQLCQQGKHMEVEINLFQVYKENIASKIGQDIKLQSTSGNPKFNGIVRSLDVYHATKERTWYTLVMDVTDFGMASKDPIDLNNELDEAVKVAQDELNRINQIKKQQETTEAQKNATDIVEESSQNPANETANNALLKELSNIKDKVEATNNEGQINSYSHMIRVLNYIQNSRFYVFGEYLKGKTPIPFTDYLAKSIINGGKYDDIQFTTKGDNLIVSARVDCATIVFTEVTSTCAYHFYWKIDTKSSNKVITRYWKNRENITTLNLDRRLFESLKGLSLNPNYLNGKRYNDSSDMSEAEFNNLTSGIVGWNGNVAKLIASEFFGCAGGSFAFAGVGLLGGPPAALSMFTVGLLECGVSALGNSIQATQEFNKNAQREDYVQIAISSAIMGFFTNLGFAVFRGVGSKVRGDSSFRQGAFGGEVIKQGGTVKGGINKISSLIPTLVNKAKDNIGKTIKYGNQTAIIDAVDGIPTINGKVAVRLKVGAETRTVPIEDIANELDNIVPSTVTTTTTSNSANSSTATSSQTAGSTLSRLTKEIDDLKLADNITKEIKSLTPENQRKVLTVIKTKNANPTKSFTISREGQPDLLVNPEDTFSISNSGFVVRKGSVVYDIPYIDVTGSKVVKTSSVPNTTNQTAPPPQPPSPQPRPNPQNIPDNRSSSPTQQTSSGGGGSQGSTVPTPVGLTGKALDNYNKLFPFNNKQFAEGKELIITLNRKVTLLNGEILKPNTQYKITEFIYDHTNNYLPSFEIKNFKWGSHPAYGGDYINYKDIVDIIIPN